jgi:hypothetical protein
VSGRFCGSALSRGTIAFLKSDRPGVPGAGDTHGDDNAIIVIAKKASAGEGPQNTRPTSAARHRQPFRSAREGKTPNYRTLGNRCLST